MTERHATARILVVDDNPENIWPLIGHLEREYEVSFATDGEKALQLASSQDRPDLILLDILMPGLDGYEICRRLKAQESTREIPILFLSGKTTAEDEARGLDLGAQDYITKPFSLQVVGARIRSVLNLKKEMDRRLLLRNQMEKFNANLEDQVRQKMEELQEARRTLQNYEERYTHLFGARSDPGRPKTILVVDDTPENIHILVEELEGEFEVVYATSGPKALEIVASNPPDLILLDVMMPGMDGYEVCSRLKADPATREIPVIFVTALGQETEETKGLQLGAVDYVTKPFRLPVVQARIKVAMRLKEEMAHRLLLTRKLEDLNRNLEKKVREKAGELQRAHEDLKLSEEKYRSIYENAIEGIFRTTPEGRFLSASPSLVRMLGYESFAELSAVVTDIGAQFWPCPAQRVEFERLLKRDGKVFDFQAEVLKKSAEAIWVSICAEEMPAGREVVPCRQGFIIDITDRKRAEENVQAALSQALEARGKVDAILRSVPIGLIVTDMAGDIILSNRAAETILGADQKSLLHRPLASFLGDERFNLYLEQTLQQRVPERSLDLDLKLGATEERRIYKIGAALALGPERMPSGAIVVIEDVTRERELARLKSEFISTAAHELNTPLTVIMGYAEILMQQQEVGELPPEQQREFLGIIYGKSAVLSRIVDELLQLSRMEAGWSLLLTKAPFSLQEMVQEVVAQFRLKPANDRFELHLQCEGMQIDADRGRLYQVVENLISNALKYSPEKTPVRVGCRRKARSCLLWVEDEGIGMSPQQVDRIFEKFYRVDATNTAVGGLGLGMSIVKNIIDAHGGAIEVHSALGKGTRVEVELPLE